MGWDGMMGWDGRDGMGWMGWMGWDDPDADGLLLQQQLMILTSLFIIYYYYNSMGWDGMGWNGMEWDGMGWDGMGDLKSRQISKFLSQVGPFTFFATPDYHQGGDTQQEQQQFGIEPKL